MCKLDMEQADAWLSYLGGCGRKDNTLHTYRHSLIRCFTCLAWGNRSYRAEDITTDDVLYLYRSLNVKEATVRTYLRTLSGMVIYHTGRDVVKQASLLFNREVRDRVFITSDEFRTLYKSADPFERMILVLGGYMGLRRCEMCAIRESDMSRGFLTIHGKGHGNGLVVTARIPDPVMREIAIYNAWKQRNLPATDDDHLLQKMNLITKKTGPAAETTVSMTVSALGKRCGVHVTTHSLRRFYATVLYYQTGCDIQTVKELMRHADVSTTLKCYVQAFDEKKREAVGKLSDYLDGLLA